MGGENTAFQPNGPNDSAHWMMCSDIDDYLDTWPIEQRLERVEWLESWCAQRANAEMVRLTGGVR